MSTHVIGSPVRVISLHTETPGTVAAVEKVPVCSGPPATFYVVRIIDGSSTWVHAAQVEADAAGYVCKACGGPAPVGVGYASHEAGAYAASRDLNACACRYSIATA